MIKSRFLIVAIGAFLIAGCGTTEFQQTPLEPEIPFDGAALTIDVVDPSFAGCTPGKWKNNLDIWPPTGYSPAQSVSSVFASAAAYSQGSNSLLEALNFGGGPGVTGGVKILLRAAVAALLNASHPGINYPLTAAEVIAGVDAALASGDRDTMLDLKDELDAYNNLGCNFGPPPPPPPPPPAECDMLITDPEPPALLRGFGVLTIQATTTATEAGVPFRIEARRNGSLLIPTYPDVTELTDGSGVVTFPDFQIVPETGLQINDTLTITVNNDPDVGNPPCTVTFIK